jgi:hypothetical protein
MDYVFDIETKGVPELVKEFGAPFDQPPTPGEFDPSQVKYGNLKDTDKRAARLQEAMEAHALAVQEYPERCRQAEAEHWQKLIDQCALAPETAKVLVIGVKSADGHEAIICGQSELDTLREFWQRTSRAYDQGARFLGANIRHFDLPFLLLRSWVNEISPPFEVWDGRYWNRNFLDLRDYYLRGMRWADCKSSVDHMARVLGIGRKDGEVTGANFARYWEGTPQEHELALAYLRRDLDIELAIARRLNLIRG